MSMEEIRGFTAVQLAEQIKRKEVGVVEATQAVLEQIKRVEKEKMHRMHSYDSHSKGKGEQDKERQT